jgi:hypothetical protein
MKKTVIEIEFGNIICPEDEREYHFDFTVSVNGRLIMQDTY